MEENTLKFDVKHLFNYEMLHEYDMDGQKGFLGYLLRTATWNIINNQIIFPNIKTSVIVEKLLKDYDTDVRKNNLLIKKDTLDKVFVYGFTRVKDMVDNDEKNIDKRIQKSKDFER